MGILRAVLLAVTTRFQNKAALTAENLTSRPHLAVPKRSVARPARDLPDPPAGGQVAAVAVPKRLFQPILARIRRLRIPETVAEKHLLIFGITIESFERPMMTVGRGLSEKSRSKACCFCAGTKRPGVRLNIQGTRTTIWERENS